MRTESAALRAQLESALSTRVPTPFIFREQRTFEMVPSGVPEIDAITTTAASPVEGRPGADSAGCDLNAGIFIADPQGGLPRGALTEIVGTDSSGRTSLMLSLLAQMTWRAEVCALVDSTDAFDPHSAAEAGADLERVLWVRCSSNVSLQAAPMSGAASETKNRTRPSGKDVNLRALEQAL